MKENPNITIRQIVDVVGIKERAVIKNINKLKSQNLLHREGADKGGKWIVVKQF